jgi:uncharacterized protein (DUF1697 family)
MSTVVAFLRAINVGGRFIKMADLGAHFEHLGLEKVSTYINSGNVLFDTRARDLSKLGAKIEEQLEPLLGFRSEVFLRSASEVHTVAKLAVEHRNSVPDSGEVNVAFLLVPLTAEQRSSLMELRTNLDDFSYSGSEVYWICRGNQMESKFSNALLERRLRLRCTFRRVSMLHKLSTQLSTAK